MWHSGIDQHKPYCVITTYGPDGPRVKQARVASTPFALARYFAEFPGAHRAVVESTGGWYWLADTLAGLGVDLVLAHATRVKAIVLRLSGVASSWSRRQISPGASVTSSAKSAATRARTVSPTRGRPMPRAPSRRLLAALDCTLKSNPLDRPT